MLPGESWRLRYASTRCKRPAGRCGLQGGFRSEPRAGRQHRRRGMLRSRHQRAAPSCATPAVCYRATGGGRRRGPISCSRACRRRRWSSTSAASGATLQRRLAELAHHAVAGPPCCARCPSPASDRPRRPTCTPVRILLCSSPIIHMQEKPASRLVVGRGWVGARRR
jgi:hypothetical protein